MTTHRRTFRIGAAALGVTILGGAAATFLANPAAAADAINYVTTVSCSVTGSNWCISGNNSSSGIGVIGTSKSGTGLRGTSTSQYGLKATSSSNYAILAQTTTGTAGVLGSSPSGIGVYGDATSSTSDSSKGLYGYSYTGFGVFGASPGSDGYGVEGNGGSLGVVGSSPSGTGVEAESGGTAHPALSVVNTGGGDGVDVTSQATTCPDSSTCAAVEANSKQGYAFLGDGK